MKKFYRNLLWTALLAISLVGILSAKVCAQTKDTQAAGTEVGRMMEIMEDTAAKAEAMDSADTVFELNKGDNVFVGTEIQDGWYSIAKGGQTAYVRKDKIKETSADPQLEEELQNQADAAEKDINLVNQYREEASKSKVWGIVIVVLVIFVFAFGILTTVQKKKGNQ